MILDGLDLQSGCKACGGVGSGRRMTKPGLEDSSQHCVLCSLILHGIKNWTNSLPSDQQELLREAAFISLFKDGKATELHFQICLVASEGKPMRGDVYLEFFLEKGDTPIKAPFAGFIPAHVPSELDISQAVAFIRKRVAACRKTHPGCIPSPEACLPKRLLRIDPNENQPILLVEAKGMQAPYIALSYCWGISSAATLRTTSETVAQHLLGLPANAFPTLFQDVFRLCRELKIQYLWLDALCIIQDSIEDWENESSKMADIYSNSYLTVSATSCKNPETGLFTERRTKRALPFTTGDTIPMRSITVKVGTYTFRVRPAMYYGHRHLVRPDSVLWDAKLVPLMTRAWAYQERMLSTRTVHFHAEELLWECNSDLQCECTAIDESPLHVLDPEDVIATEDASKTETSNTSLKSSLASLISRYPNVTRSEVARNWMNLVEGYSGLLLSFNSDRLHALSGIAGVFARMAPSPNSYVAGIWVDMLPMALLWRNITYNPPNEGEEGYQPSAPSWSWASIRIETLSYGMVTEVFRSPSHNFKVLDVTWNLLGDNPFGWVKDAVLSVRGDFIDCTVGLYGIHYFSNRATIKYGWALEPKERPEYMFIASHSLALALDIADDTRHEGRELSVLHVGSYCCLVLEKQHGEYSGRPRYRRVGLATWFRDKATWDRYWTPRFKISDIDLV